MSSRSSSIKQKPIDPEKMDSSEPDGTVDNNHGHPIRDFASLKDTEVLDAFGNEDGAEVKCRLSTTPIHHNSSLSDFDFRQDYDLVAGRTCNDCGKYISRNSLSTSSFG